LDEVQSLEGRVRLVRSPRERLVADAKHYAFDVELQCSVSVSRSVDRGRRLENAVAIELFRRGYSLSHLDECDFIAEKTGSRPFAVQVCDCKGELPSRALKGLKKGVRACKGDGLLLVSGEVEAALPKNVSVKTVQDFLSESP
jgi:predicted AAA+ superfamily ATPase